VAVQRISKTFKDISMSFKVNPLNDDLIAIKNQTAIARSLRNLVLTAPGERFFNENLGSNVNNLLFENMDDVTASSIKDEIQNTINNYEPRVKLLKTQVSPNFETLEFDVVIRYEIIGVEAQPQQLSFALEPAR
jgi:phage baseplate assembly protein W